LSTRPPSGSQQDRAGATRREGPNRDARKELCTLYNDGPVPTGGACTGDLAGKTITVVVNDDGMGGRGTVECNTSNNTAQTIVTACEPPR
jgi:hypothetical protein